MRLPLFIGLTLAAVHGQHAPNLSFTFDQQYYTGDPRIPFNHPEPYYDEKTGDQLRGVLLQPPAPVGQGIELTYLVAGFSLSYMSPEEQVHQWFVNNDAPARHNPLRLASVFQGTQIEKDENNSTCIGHDFTTEICIQSIDCVTVRDGVSLQLRVCLYCCCVLRVFMCFYYHVCCVKRTLIHLNSLFPILPQEPFFLPTPVVSNYRTEAVIIPPNILSTSNCAKAHLRGFHQVPDQEAQYLMKILASVAATGEGAEPLKPVEFLMPYIDGNA